MSRPRRDVHQLRDGGVKVEDETEDTEYGRFGWARDLEGNRIELWEPVPGWRSQRALPREIGG